jgi:hypothetical protein
MTVSATNRGLKPGVCTSTARPSNPFDGMVIYETDTDKTLVWNGSAWVYLATGTTNAPGLELVTSATFSAATTVTIDGCFTSTYRNYLLVIDTDATASTTLRFVYRTSGVDNTSSTYNYGRHQGDNGNGSTTNYAASAAFGLLGIVGDIKASCSITFYAPQVAVETAVTGQFFSYHSTGAADFGSIGGAFNNTTQFDGLKFYPGSGNITGRYAVYGYRNS